MEHYPLMVSISGASCSGKTSVSQMLSIKYPHSIIIHQDDYYLDVKHVPECNGYKVWDEEASFDWSRLLHTIQATITNPTNKCGRCAVTQTSTQQHVIIIEGIQIFRNKYILERSDLSYFIQIDREKCLERRRLRTDYTDPTIEYFDTCVWSNYCHMKDTAMKLDSVKFLNGQTTLDDIFQKIHQDTKHLLSTIH